MYVNVHTCCNICVSISNMSGRPVCMSLVLNGSSVYGSLINESSVTGSLLNGSLGQHNSASGKQYDGPGRLQIQLLWSNCIRQSDNRSLVVKIYLVTAFKHMLTHRGSEPRVSTVSVCKLGLYHTSLFENCILTF